MVYLSVAFWNVVNASVQLAVLSLFMSGGYAFEILFRLQRDPDNKYCFTKELLTPSKLKSWTVGGLVVERLVSNARGQGSLGVASSLISLETFAGRFDESWVDRLNHVWTVVVLVLFAIVVSAEQFLGNPIRCLCPLPKCSVDFMAYANSYCWNRNTYYRVPKDLVPIEDIKQGEIQTTYYQWVPMILLLQALSFRLPNIIWRIYSRTSDIDLNKVVELAEKVSTANLEERQKVVTDLAELMDRWLSNLRHYTFNPNVIVHLAILDSFMTSKGSSMYGIEVLPRLGADDAWHQSPHFPSETLCELHIRHLQNVTTLSLQCVLPINAFSEKVFVFLCRHNT
nr:hypothetical protein BaRGS_026856 [Batillaria attramentaria]